MKNQVMWGLGCALLLIGCAQNRALAGSWKGEIKLDGDQSDAVSKEIARSLADTMSLNLELKSDGTYVEQVLFFSITGDWQETKGQLILQPKFLDKQPIDQVKDPELKRELLQTKAFTVDQNSGTFSRKSPSGDYQEIYKRDSQS